MLDEIIYDIVDDGNEEESGHEGRNLDYGHDKSDSHEGSTAKKALLTMAKDLYHLYVTLNDSDDLPEWCHYKLATSRKDLSDVTDYITSKILKHCLDNKIDHEGLQEAIKLSMKSDLINENIFSKLKDKIFSSKKKDNKTKPANRFDKSLKDTVPLSKSSVEQISNDRNRNLRKSNIIFSLYSDVENSKKIMETLSGLTNKTLKFKRSKSFFDETEIARSHLERPFVAILNENGYLTAIDKISSYLRHYKKLNENQEKDIKIVKALPSMAGPLYPAHKPATILELSDSEFGASVEDFIKLMGAEYNKNIDDILNTLEDTRLNLTYIVTKISNFLNKKNIKDDAELSRCMTRLQDITAGKDKEKTYDFSGLLVKQDDVVTDKSKQKDIKPIKLKSEEERKKYSYNSLKDRNPYIAILAKTASISNYYKKNFGDNIVAKDTLQGFYANKNQSEDGKKFVEEYHNDFMNVIDNIDYLIEKVNDLYDDIAKVYPKNESKSIVKENSSLEKYHDSLLKNVKEVESVTEYVDDRLDIISNIEPKAKLMLVKDVEDQTGRTIFSILDKLSTGLINIKYIYEIGYNEAI